MSYFINSISYSYPSGSILSYLGSTDPSGWIIANGVVRTDNSDGKYNGLAALSIGIGGSGTNNYTPPDFRGTFLRGIGTNGIQTTYSGPSALGVNGFNTVNGYQLDTIKSHTHTITDPGHQHSIYYTRNFYSNAQGGGTASRTAYTLNTSVTGESTSGITINASGGIETRPVNIGINWIIKL